MTSEVSMEISYAKADFHGGASPHHPSPGQPHEGWSRCGLLGLQKANVTLLLVMWRGNPRLTALQLIPKEANKANISLN